MAVTTPKVKYSLGVTESVDVVAVVEDGLKISGSSLLRHGVDVVRDFCGDSPTVVTQKHKLLQIIVNLIANAKQALAESNRDDRILTLRIEAPGEYVRIRVRDNGVGIPKKNLTKIFSSGFTTRSDRHGFGLHSSVLVANELGGSLSVFSDGLGEGATFTLQIPVRTTDQ